MNKKGMSQLITTILLILLILVALAAVWFAIDKLILSGTGKINLESLTLDLKIKSAIIDFDTGIATVRVVRNPGGGNLTAIKFIVEDTRNSEIFDFKVENFFELVERTFELNISEGPALSLEKVHKISIAPLYVSGTSGIETLGPIGDTVGGLNKNINISEEEEEEEQTPIPDCSIASDCGTDTWIEGSEICSQDKSTVLQYKETFSCEFGFCTSETKTFIKENCISGEICYAGNCILDIDSCTVETVTTDCGIDGLVGVPRCALVGEAVVQDYREYSCVNSLCSSADSEVTLNECVGEEICFSAECFIPLECTLDSDCDACELCEEGTCVEETVINNGTIRSVWPYGAGEYFDSFNLPTSQDFLLTGNYIIFPGSLQTSCLKISSHIVPPVNSTGLIAYVRLNESKTNISDTNNYEIWKTTCVC